MAWSAACARRLMILLVPPVVLFLLWAGQSYLGDHSYFEVYDSDMTRSLSEITSSLGRFRLTLNQSSTAAPPGESSSTSPYLPADAGLTTPSLPEEAATPAVPEAGAAAAPALPEQTISTEKTPLTGEIISKSQYFSIHVVDQDTGRGIPLVFLKTTFKAVYMTDSAGYVAFLEPGLMTGRQLWLTVSSYGYHSPEAGFGTTGTPIHPTPGGSATISLQRLQIAERLYRMTGFGIYRDSLLLGQSTPIERPVLNADVAGSDTIQCAEFKGKLLWMWQDTDQMAWPLGNFNMTGATTDLPRNLDPEKGLNFNYYTTNDGSTNFARPMTDIRLKVEGSFPVWVDGLTVVPDRAGQPRLIARYCASNGDLRCVEEGLVLWNDEREIFERLSMFKRPGTGTPAPSGHAFYAYDSEVRYAYYGTNVRVKADFESASDPIQYEAFTCLTADGKQVHRGRDGSAIWKWKKGVKPVNYENIEQLDGDGILPFDQSPYPLLDPLTGHRIRAAQVAIAFNVYLGLWVNIIQQKWGDTMAGEIWFSTARTFEGPWQYVRKVTTHNMSTDGYRDNHNDLYNPVQHHQLQQDNGRLIYFSGTLTNSFSGNQWPTPYYNYNNIMYRLNLSDARLKLPTPPTGLWMTVPVHSEGVKYRPEGEIELNG